MIDIRKAREDEGESPASKGVWVKRRDGSVVMTCVKCGRLVDITGPVDEGGRIGRIRHDCGLDDKFRLLEFY